MKEDFFKFPSTPHLARLGNIDIRTDKVMSDSDKSEFLRHEIVVEEKVDGANLGISFDSAGEIRLQNRGEYLQPPTSGQWKKLAAWLSPRTDILFKHLADRHILFGEWCYAKHSIFYNRLPDWFIGFDVYDKQPSRFLSCERRNAFFEKIHISPVPFIARGIFSPAELIALLSHSRLSDQPAEGLYLRIDLDGWLLKRAKLVRPAFTQSIEQHWSKSQLKANRLSNNLC